MSLLCWISLIFVGALFFLEFHCGGMKQVTTHTDIPFRFWHWFYCLTQSTSADRIIIQKSSLPLFVTFIVSFFLRIIVEPDPFWRLPLWIETLTLSVCSVLLIRNSKIALSVRSLSLVALYLLPPLALRLESWVVLSLSNQIGYITRITFATRISC